MVIQLISLLFINYYRTQSSKKDLESLKADVKKLYRKLFN